MKFVDREKEKIHVGEVGVLCHWETKMYRGLQIIEEKTEGVFHLRESTKVTKSPQSQGRIKVHCV